MIGYKGEKPFCDLQCRVCDGWVMKCCLFSGTVDMRMLMTVCLAKGVLLDESHILGLWKDSVVLDSRELSITPPQYKNEVEN